jgi:hypothetical protein
MTDLANDLIIDFFFVEPTTRTYGTYNKAGLHWKEKKRKENKSNMSINTGPGLIFKTCT